MKTVPVSMTLPSDLIATLRAKAADGQIRSVSSFVADTVAAKLNQEAERDRRQAWVEDYINRYLGGTDAESEAFVADVIAEQQRKAEQR